MWNSQTFKKKVKTLFGFFIFAFFSLFFPLISVFSQANRDFNSPWLNSNTPIILDAYHKNSIDWNKLREDKRVAGIIHKATEGETFADPKYQSRRNLAKANGYKWGSFHLLKKGNPIKQAEFYLNNIGPDTSDEIMALDVECTENTSCDALKYKVSVEEIKTFLIYIKQKTGRYPILYANRFVVEELSEKFSNDEIFTKTPLWYARFRKKVDDFPEGIWKTYTFWQFSSEINCQPGEECLYKVPGTFSDMDINVYNGTIEEMRTNWANIGK